MEVRFLLDFCLWRDTQIVTISLLIQIARLGLQYALTMVTTTSALSAWMTLIAQRTDLHVKMVPACHVMQTFTAMEPPHTVDRIIPARDA